MPKVVHLTSVHRPLDTRILHKECRTLARAGFEVVLIAPGAADEVRSGVRIRGVPKRSGRLRRTTLTAASVVRAALAEDASLYHFHDPELLPWAQWLRLTGRRVIFDMHEDVPASIQTKPWIRPAVRRAAAALYRQAERALLAGVPVVFAETAYREAYPDIARTVTVLNMPVLEGLLETRGEPHATPTVGYVGGVSETRGATVVLEALRRLDRQGVEVHWDCVGPVSGEAYALELSGAARALGEDTVRLHGYLPQESAWPLISRCHIGLAVLQPVANYVHSYPTKLFEYMALGLPVVASDFPLYREVIETAGCGLCVDPTDPGAVAAAIARLIQDPVEARAMGARGRDAVCTRFRWQAEADKLLEFYALVLRS